MPSHAVKNGIRYRYYVSRSLITGLKNNHRHGMRIPAADLENLVRDRLCQFLSHQAQLLDELQPGPHSDIQSLLNEAKLLAGRLKTSTNTYTMIQGLVRSLTVHADHVTLEIALDILAEKLRLSGAHITPTLTLSVPARLKRNGRVVRLLIQPDGKQPQKPQVDPALVASLQLAHRWWNCISEEGLNVTALAMREKLSTSYVSRMIRLAFLAPDITTAILSGTHPCDITAKRLAAPHQIPVSWQQQRQALGFGS